MAIWPLDPGPWEQVPSCPDPCLQPQWTTPGAWEKVPFEGFNLVPCIRRLSHGTHPRKASQGGRPGMHPGLQSPPGMLPWLSTWPELCHCPPSPRAPSPSSSRPGEKSWESRGQVSVLVVGCRAAAITPQHTHTHTPGTALNKVIGDHLCLVCLANCCP